MESTDRDALVLTAMEAVRAFSDSMDHMHGTLRGDTGMNATDLAAVRMLTMREHAGEVVTPNDIAAHLSISTASTTALLDRLSARGHVERRPHPHDRRSRVIVLTDAARADFHRHFDERMRKMRAALAAFGDDELRSAVRFLDGVAEALAE